MNSLQQSYNCFQPILSLHSTHVVQYWIRALFALSRRVDHCVPEPRCRLHWQTLQSTPATREAEKQWPSKESLELI